MESRTTNNSPQTPARWPLLGLLVYAFGTGFSGALMPGPLLSVTLADAAQHGFWAGPLLMVGHGALELSAIIALAVGLGAVLRNRYVFAGLGLIGGAVLIWMGQGMLTPPDAATVAFLHGGGPAASSGWTAATAAGEVLRGLVTSVSNPYWTLWWATVGMALIARAKQGGRLGLGALFVGHISSDILWYLIVAAAVAFGRSFMSVAFYRWLVGACGVFLIAMAAYFIFSGLRELRRPRIEQASD